jgi:hypothetical protein
MQSKLDKNIIRGKLSDVDEQKERVKITKQQLKVKELEADIITANRKVEKLKR